MQMKFVYKMSFYPSKRHTISHTNMYFARESDTRWGHHDPLCKITVIPVDEDSTEYESAMGNTRKAIDNIINGIDNYAY